MASHAATGCGDARGKTGDALSDGAIRLITCQHVLAKDQDPTNPHRRAVRVASSGLHSKRERAYTIQPSTVPACPISRKLSHT
jgi:hypothetical protein